MSLSQNKGDLWHRLIAANWLRILETRKTPVAPVLMNAITSDPMQDNLRVAVVRMCAELAGADRLYASRPEERRNAARLAIGAVLSFLERLDEHSNDWTGHLIALQAALAELDRGIVPPMLAPSPTRGRRRDSNARLMVKVGAAATMSVLMEAGLGREKAAKLVENALRRCGVELKGSWRTVADWRDEARNAQTGSSIASIYPAYVMWMGKVEGLSSADGDRFLKGVLVKLSEHLEVIGRDDLV